jgi:PadR family transcriptional regulator, regulatory protein PadR
MDMDRELLKGNTPTLVLAVLLDGPLHGYGIAREIERRSGNVLRFREGTLYPALHALEHQGLLTSEWQRDDRGRDKRLYGLTPAGRAALAERTERWARFTTAVEQVLGGQDDVESAEVPEAGGSGIPGSPRRAPSF